MSSVTQAGRGSGPDHGAEPLRDTARRWLLSNEFGLILLIVVFSIVFALSFPGFTTKFSLFGLGRTMAVNIVIGFSMMVVIVTGGLNLAVGAIAACVVMSFGWANEAVGLPLALALVVGLAAGAALGWINGFITQKSGIQSFVVTLATMSIFFGVMIFLTKAAAFRGLSPDVAAFGKARYGGVISPLVFVAILIALGLGYLYRFTALGREMLAAGASTRAARLSGSKVGTAVIASHVLSGLLAGIAGLMLTTRHGAALPSLAGDLGQDWLLPAFLAPVLGGTLLTGGHVSVFGTLLGGALVTLLQSGLLFMNVGAFWQQCVLGGLLLVAVLMDRARRLYLVKRGLA